MNLCLWSIFPHVTFYQYILLSSIHDRHNTFTSVLKHPPPHRRRIHLAIYLSIVTVFFLLSFMFLVYICWDVCVSVRQYIYIFSSILRCRPNQMCLIFVVVLLARVCVCYIFFLPFLDSMLFHIVVAAPSVVTVFVVLSANLFFKFICFYFVVLFHFLFHSLDFFPLCCLRAFVYACVFFSMCFVFAVLCFYMLLVVVCFLFVSISLRNEISHIK